MWELTNADATLPVAPDNFRFNMGQSGKETASQAAEKLPFAISVVWKEGTFLITKEGAPYLARFWPDVGKRHCWLARECQSCLSISGSRHLSPRGNLLCYGAFSRPSKSSCFVSGHDFSRAETA